MAVPIAMLRTSVRSGFWISSPAKPMLFHESEENSEPVMAMPMPITRPPALSGSTGPATPGRGRARGVPEVVEIGLHRLGVQANKQPEQDEQRQRHELGGAEHVLNELAGLHAARVHRRDDHDEGDGQQLHRRKLEMPATNVHFKKNIFHRKPRHQHARELGKRHRHGRDKTPV